MIPPLAPPASNSVSSPSQSLIQQVVPPPEDADKNANSDDSDEESEDIPLSKHGELKNTKMSASLDDSSEEDIPLANLGRPKRSSKGQPKRSFKGRSSNPMANMASSSRANFEEKNTEYVTIIDVTTLFDPINPTFLGFDPQNTWPCSNAESVTVDYVNGHGGHDARIPITDFGMT